MIRTVLSSLAAASLAAAPVAAHAAAAPERSSAPAAAANQLEGQSTLFFVLGIVAVAVGIFLLIDDDDAVSA